MPGPDALILCGGQAARLGGIDKPLRALAQRPLIARVIERLAPQAGRLTISANRNRAAYAALGHAVIDDGARRDCGPLAGIAAGLAVAHGEFLACVPGDAPRLPLDLVARLSAALAAHRADIAHVHDGQGPQPLCCLIRRRLLADLQAYLDDEGGRTPREWFGRHASVAVDFSEQPRWIWSLNTAEEWRQAERQLAALRLAP
ncbi:MAG: molybdenum cofactor guanylyltransferase MobA [Nevskia sp.]